MGEGVPGASFASHMPGLDGLRGVAILLILAHNFNLLEGVESPVARAVDLALNFGWVGVQLFFVLSGFLITNILISTREAKNYFRSFYGRRTLRIFPLYYASLAVGLILIPLVTGERIAGAEHQIWLWTYLANWAAPNGLAVEAYPHMWSLAVEEQFYLIWPFLVYYLSRAALLRACVVIAVVALAVRIGLRLWDDNLEAVYQYTICRMDALSIGAAAAVLFRRIDVHQFVTTYRSQLRFIIVFGLVGVFVITRGAPRTGILTQTYGHTLLALLAAAVILDLARAPTGDRVAGLFSWAPLRRVGAYSYSAYVIHKPLHAYVGQPLLQHAGWSERGASSWVFALVYFALASILTLAVSAASYHAFEMPFLKLKRYFVASKPAHIP